MGDLAQFIVDATAAEIDRLIAEEGLDDIDAAVKAHAVVMLRLRGQAQLGDLERWVLQAVRDLSARMPGRSFLRSQVMREVDRQRERGLHDIDRAEVTIYRALIALEGRHLVHRPKGVNTKYWVAAPMVVPTADILKPPPHRALVG